MSTPNPVPARLGSNFAALREHITGWVNVRSFGAKGDGGTDDTAAFVAAALAAAGSGGVRTVYAPGATYLFGSTLALTGTHSGVKFVGAGTGATYFKKGFSGDLITVANAPHVGFSGIHFQGQHGTYTGRGIVFSGSNSDYPKIEDVAFEGFTGTSLEFGANAGENGKFSRIAYITGTGQTDVQVIKVAGPDTSPMFRLFELLTLSRGYITLVGAQNTQILNSVFHRVETDADCTITVVMGCEWANEDVTTMTLYGPTFYAIGNRFAGDVVLDSTFTGSFIGNSQTSGTFTNNTTPDTAQVFHHPTTGGTFLGPHRLRITSGNAAERILSSRVANISTDGDVTLTVTGSAPTTRLTGAITADRTCTISTTNAVAGDRFRVIRTGGGAFNWDVGPGLKTLATAGVFADFEYDGSAWIQTGYGAL